MDRADSWCRAAPGHAHLRAAGVSQGERELLGVGQLGEREEREERQQDAHQIDLGLGTGCPRCLLLSTRRAKAVLGAGTRALRPCGAGAAGTRGRLQAAGRLTAAARVPRGAHARPRRGSARQDELSALDSPSTEGEDAASDGEQPEDGLSRSEELHLTEETEALEELGR